MKKIVYMIIVCFFVGGIYASAYAQKPDKPMQKIEQFKKMKLLETLDLDEETANKFLVKYDKWEKEISEMNQDRMICVQELRLALEKKSGDDEINRTLDSLTSVTAKVDDARRQMFADIRSMLTARQSAKLALFEAQFHKRLQEALERIQRHNHDSQFH